MKVFFALLFIYSVCAKNHHHRPESTDADQNTTKGHSKGFPDFFRIEVEIQKLENVGSLRSDGKECDWKSKCDPVVSAAIDIEKPVSAFPGATPPVNTWPTIFTATDNDSPTIGASVNRDVCGGAVNKVNARVNILDADTPGLSDTINQFDCVYRLEASDIAEDALSAKWSAPFECTAYFQASKMKLYARQRAYQISEAICAGPKPAGSEATQTPKAEVSPSAQFHSPGEHDFIRLDVELVQLLDPQGITYKKVACDSTSKCDPYITANLDTDKPLAHFPGSKQVNDFIEIFSVTDVDSPVINKNVSKDVCGGAVNYVNLRAHVEDNDSPLSRSDLIDDFNCLFKVNYKTVSRALSSADWAPTQDCVALHAGHDIRLQYRYRIYDISAAECHAKN